MSVLGVLELGIMPILLLWAFVVAALMPGRLPYVRPRRAARAGFWSGPVLVAVLALWLPPTAADQAAPGLAGVDPLGAAAGLVVGFATPVLFRRIQGHDLRMVQARSAVARRSAWATTRTWIIGTLPHRSRWGARALRLEQFAATRIWIGVLTLVASTASTGAGYLYLAFPASRDLTASVVLFGVLGLLLRVVMNPTVSTESPRPALRQL